MCYEFLDMSKAFERAWHKGLMYKSIIDNRYQRVLIVGQKSH